MSTDEMKTYFFTLLLLAILVFSVAYSASKLAETVINLLNDKTSQIEKIIEKGK